MTIDVNGHTSLPVQISSGPGGLEHLLDSIPALIARIDCNMFIQYSNKAFQELFPVSNFVSTPSLPIVVGSEIFDVIQRHLGKMLVGQPAKFVIPVFDLGIARYFDVNLTPEFDERQQVRNFIFHASDVTVKTNVQRDLEDYVENATIGLHWVGSDGKIIWANSAELRMLGYEEDDYIGHHISEFHKNQSCIEDILQRLANNEVLRNYEAELICKDGSIKHVAINSSVLWEGGKFMHTRCFTVDITMQKMVLKALIDSEARFRTIADLAPVIIWTTDEHGKSTFFNAKWRQLTGLSADVNDGTLWLEGVHSADSQNITTSWDKSFAERKAFEAKLRFRNSEGGYSISLVHAVPRFDSDNVFLGYIGIMQDLTSEEKIKSSLERMVLQRVDDLKRKNLELQRAENALILKNKELKMINEELSAFAHITSHDLQEPLRKIQTYADRVMHFDSELLSNKGKEGMIKIHRASHKMRKLIQDILSYAECNATDTSYVEMTDLNDLVAEVIDEYEIRIEETKASIVNHGLPTLPVVRVQFHQLFLNLISNALKFARPGVLPQIVLQSEIVTGEHVDGTTSDKFYHISVADNGRGFDSQYAEKIFEIFTRLFSDEDVGGTGIGLSVCKKIVERHGGKIIAESKISQGAVFHIYLPLSQNDPTHLNQL
jgi:PAS domain S-box-containing protein